MKHLFENLPANKLSKKGLMGELVKNGYSVLLVQEDHLFLANNQGVPRKMICTGSMSIETKDYGPLGKNKFDLPENTWVVKELYVRCGENSVWLNTIIIIPE